MSVLSLSPDVVWIIVNYKLTHSSALFPIYTKSDQHKRLLELLCFSATCRVARALTYQDVRFKGLMISLAPGKEVRGGVFASMAHSYARIGRKPLKAPEAWREDRAVVLAAVKSANSFALQISSCFLNDKEVVLAAIEHEPPSMLSMHSAPNIYTLIPEELRLDHDVARAALRKIDMLLTVDKPESFPAAIRDSKDLMLELLSGQGPTARECGGTLPLTFASDRLRADRDVVLAAVTQKMNARNPNLQHASEALRDDRDIVEAAIGATGGGFNSLQFASARLRDDRDLALLAIQSYTRKHSGCGLDTGFRSLSMRLRSDRSLFMEALAKSEDRHCPHLLSSAGSALQEDRQTVLAVVTRNALGIQVASEAFCADRDLIFVAVRQEGYALSCASDALQADRDVVLSAVSNVGTAIQFAAEDLLDDYDIALAACTNEGAALEFVSRRLRNNRSIRAAARAERAALIAKVGGIENLCDIYGAQDPDRDYDREMRAQQFNLRPDPYGEDEYDYY